jgi:hypothetical protein
MDTQRLGQTFLTIDATAPTIKRDAADGDRQDKGPNFAGPGESNWSDFVRRLGGTRLDQRDSPVMASRGDNDGAAKRRAWQTAGLGLAFRQSHRWVGPAPTKIESTTNQRTGEEP